MELKSSPKTYKNYKSSPPEATIAAIENGFRKLRIELEYFPRETSTAVKIHSGICRIKNTPIKTDGKGCSQLLSKASAYAEMAERFSSGASFNKFKNLWKYNNLPLELQIKKDTIEYCINRKFYKGYRYEDVSESTRKITADRFHIPYDNMNKTSQRLHQSDWTKFHWVDGYSLSKNQKVSIPIKHLEYVARTNGLAAGNTIEEAITQGTCEIFERFCFLQVMKNGHDVPTIDHSTIEDNQIKELIRYYNDLNIEVKIKDFSLRGRFPVIGAVFINHNLAEDSNPLKKSLFYHQVSAGAAIDPAEAVIRCLTERMQGYTQKEMMTRPITDIIWRYWVNEMGKPYKVDFDYRLMFAKGQVSGDLPFLTGDKMMIPFSVFRRKLNNDFLHDIHCLMGLCEQENLELIVIDITHPTIEFPSVRVLIPEISWINSQEPLPSYIFKDFLFDDTWFDDDAKVNSFVDIAENYLSSHLFENKITTIFGTEISLFKALSIAKFKIQDYKEALSCFLLTKALTGTTNYDGIIDLLLTQRYDVIRRRYPIKNPLMHGWNLKEKVFNESIIPMEIGKLFSSLRAHNNAYRCN